MNHNNNNDDNNNNNDNGINFIYVCNDLLVLSTFSFFYDMNTFCLKFSFASCSLFIIIILFRHNNLKSRERLLRFFICSVFKG